MVCGARSAKRFMNCSVASVLNGDNDVTAFSLNLQVTSKGQAISSESTTDLTFHRSLAFSEHNKRYGPIRTSSDIDNDMKCFSPLSVDQLFSRAVVFTSDQVRQLSLS